MKEYRRHPGRLWPSPEQELLLQAALLDGDDAAAAFQRWRDDIDLDDELGYPVLRLLPLVYWNLQRLGLNDPLMGRLKGVYRRFWCENQALFFAMHPSVRRLAEGGIELLLLKGAPLVLSYYRNHALRPMADFDIAIRMEQIPRALALLKDDGWLGCVEPSSDDRRYFHALPLRKGQLELDIHYRPLRECVTADADRWFWSDVESVEFQGIRACQLAPTALLLHTMAHGVRWNLEPPIRWIPDAMAIMRQRGDEIDWDRLLAFADAERLTHRLALALTYLTERFAVALPPCVLARIGGHRPGVLERIANSAILGDSTHLYAHPIGKQWVMLADYCALVREPHAWRLAWGFTHYLRYRWKLRGRREILTVAVRGLIRRLRSARAA